MNRPFNYCFGNLVPGRGLEPPQCCHRMDLNHVRLPIPPSGLEEREF